MDFLDQIFLGGIIFFALIGFLGMFFSVKATKDTSVSSSLPSARVIDPRLNKIAQAVISLSLYGMLGCFGLFIVALFLL